MASQDGLIGLLRRKKLLRPLLMLLFATIAAEILILHLHLSRTGPNVQDRRRNCNHCHDELANTSRSISARIVRSTNVDAYAKPLCADPLCKEYLSKSEKYLFHKCLYETTHPRLNKLSEGPLVEETPSPCRFQNANEMRSNHTTLLVSFPGSGNTWVRGLLQQLTGICTGSVFCDIDLRRRGFPGDGIVGESTGVFVLFTKIIFHAKESISVVRYSALCTLI